MGEQLQFPWWAYYPKIEKIEVLYWRGMVRTNWWNNYARELVEYAKNNLPLSKVDFVTYNVNSNPNNTDWKLYKNRMWSLQRHKLSKHPLVAINDHAYIGLITSGTELEQMMDWIDAEHTRHYGKPKSNRKPSGVSPLLVEKYIDQKLAA